MSGDTVIVGVSEDNAGALDLGHRVGCGQRHPHQLGGMESDDQFTVTLTADVSSRRIELIDCRVERRKRAGVGQVALDEDVTVALTT